jgi:hypothetical protein
MENVTSVDKIEKKYDKSGFLVKYGGSITAAIILLSSFGLIITYLCIKVYAKPIKDDWEKYKCNPLILPFAGLIQDKPVGEVSIYTAENFSECANSILEQIVITFTKPVYQILDNIVLTFNRIAEGVQKLRNDFFKLFKKLQGLSSYIQNKILSVIIPFQKLLIKLKDTLSRVAATVSASFMAILGINLAFGSWLKSVITTFIIIFVMSAMYLIYLWIIPFTWIPAAIGTAIWVTFFTFFAIVAGWVGYIYKQQQASMPAVPGKPACFDENTIIKTINGDKKMKDIKLNDRLGKDNIVTAIFKVKNTQNMYNLNNITVSGAHYVYHDKWIQVKDHPNAILIPNYNKNIIYCINTTNKRIKINNTIFADWDDLNAIDFMKLKNYRIINNIKNLHSITDSGLNEKTIIDLKNDSKFIKDICVGDILINNEKVLAIIKIKADDLKNKKCYSFKNQLIYGSNLYFTSTHLGEFTTIEVHHSEKVFYHIITDTGKFTINNIEIYDYNSAIEHILDIRDKYSKN